MKRKTAKEILAESFRELSEKESVDRITVIEIAENCGYSSTTFYRQFSDKYDLIAWSYTQQLEEILYEFNKDPKRWKQILLNAALFYQKQQEYPGKKAAAAELMKRRW